MRKRSILPDAIELAEQKRKLLEYMLREEGLDLADPETILPTERAGQLPVSFAQQRLWFLEQMNPGSPTYNIPAAVRLSGRLDVRALEHSLNAIVRRHESLRTKFLAVDGRPVQIVEDEISLSLSVTDLAHIPDAQREETALRLAAQDASSGFDLTAAPLMRVSLLRLGETDHLLLLTLHHIVSDGWSMGVMIRELVRLYDAFVSGRTPQLPELPIQYKDYALWQRDWLQGQVLEEQLEYWRKQLGGDLPALAFPTDHPRPVVQSHRGAFESRLLPRALSDRLKDLSRCEDVTLFVTLLAAFNTLLYRYSGQEDIPVGVPIANRNRQELEGLIGYFANTLVIRTDLSDDPSFRKLLARVRKISLDAYAHQDLPFEKLVEELQPVRNVSHTPLFQVMFVLQNAPMPAVTIAGLDLSPMNLGSGTAKFDLMLSVEDLPEGLAATVEYRAGLFEAATVRRLLSHYETLLGAINTNPDERISSLRVLTEDELESIKLKLKIPAEPAQSRSLVDLFEEQVARSPERVAVTFDGQALSYGELNNRANKLAWHLRRFGAGLDTFVGICVERSSDMIVGLLGILKSGAAYVPLDPSYPGERLSLIVEDSAIRVMVTQKSLVGHLGNVAAHTICIDGDWNTIEREEGQNLNCPLSPDNASYVIYTSGSTGRPKGVVVSHRNVVRLFEATSEKFHFSPQDVWTLFHSYAFDFSVWELWGALIHGGRLVVVPFWVSRTPEAYHQLLVDEAVTIVNQTPSAMRQLIDAHERAGAERTPALREVILGGEALDVNILRRWIDDCGDQRPEIINMYGITETTVHVTYRQISAADLDAVKRSPIGEAIEDLHIYLLDPQLQPVPMLVAGEIWVAGEGLARGYFNQPALTAERFRPDIWSTRAGARMYRSGDQGRARGEADIEYLGRLDEQVKIRGFRIEAGEIEAVLNAHPKVAQSVVVVDHENAPEKRLIGYVLPRASEQLKADELRAFLKERLPDYMVPAAILQVERIPLTAHGKVDRKALPAMDWTRRESEGVFAPPGNPVEHALAEVWSSVLGVSPVGVHDNYFSLGGDSILSIQIRSRAREKGIDFSLQQLFRYQTIRELSGHISALDREAASRENEEKAQAKRERFRLVSERDRSKLPVDCENAYPLSDLQAGMVFHSEYTTDYIAYITSFHLRVWFDRQKFQLALDEMSARHEMLRSSFDVTSYSEPLQVVSRRAPLTVAVEDLRHLSPAEQDLWIEDWTTAEMRRKFDWTEAPLLRVHVHLRGCDSIQFSMTEPFFDGWSVASFLTELFERYFARLSGHPLAVEPLLEASYEDFVELEREALQSEECLSYWESKLRDATACGLPRWPAGADAGNPREVVRMEVEVPVEVSDGLKALARSAGVSLKSVLLAAHMKVVSLIGGQTDPITGLLINGRPERIDGERLLGAFLNTAPFTLKLDAMTWLELARRVFEAENDMLPFRRYPIQELQRLYKAERLFDTVFNYTHFHVLDRLRGLPELEVLSQTGNEQTYFALTAQFNIDGSTSRVRLELDYRTAVLGERLAREIAGYYSRVLAAMAAEPESQHQSCLLSERELRLISDLNNSGEATSDPRCIHLLFEEQAARTPHAIAVVADDLQLTYCELNHRANRLAHLLKRMGIGPEILVGICIRRSVEMIVGVLGVLKSGGAYLPLDTEYPSERIRFMLDESRAPVVITSDELTERCSGTDAEVLEINSLWDEIAGESSENPPGAVTPANLAYVIYTSGSTGAPKGVLIEHRGVTNIIKASSDAFEINGSCKVAQLASLSFDASVLEIFTALSAGATLCLVSREVVSSGPDLAETLKRQNVTAMMTTPSTLDRIPADDFAALSTITVGGEACSPETAARWSQGRQFWNVYAPTEATIFATAKKCDEGARTAPTLGGPVANMRIYSLARDLNPIPTGVVGELFTGGSGVARGYLNRPELTAERFIPDAFSDEPGQRLYKTGDLARWRVDNELEFLGRVDRQVKIRGFRIEPGEIEFVLGANADVKETVVVAREDSDERRLVAYVVPRDRDMFAANELHAYLKARLPEYMVPSAFVPMDCLPLTATGKIDRRALPAPEQARPALTQVYVAPRTPIEEMLAVTWSELLKIDQVGIRDNFFEMGGHSLLATQAISRVRSAFQVELSLRALFENPTIESFSARLEETLRAQQGFEAQSIKRVPCEWPLPLSFAQQRLWFFDQFEPGSPLYNIAAAVSITGPLNIAVLERAIQEIEMRHESLRTTFPSHAGTPVQIISSFSQIRLQVTDLRQSKSGERMEQSRRLAEEEARKPFSLVAEPLLRATLLRLDEETFWLLLTMHHIVSDGWSMGIFVQELASLYEAFSEGKPSPLSEPVLQYADFAVWQRDWLKGETLERQLEYWKERLAGSPPLLDMPSDRPRPPVQTSNGAVESLPLGADLTIAIKQLSRVEGVTLFMTLLAALDVLAYRYTGQHDVLIGTPIANRNRADVEGLIGFFVNTIVMRVDLSGEPTFRELLARVRETALNAYAHQDLPFEKLVEELNPARNTSHSPLFQIMLDVQNAPMPPLLMKGLRLEPLLVETNTAKFDLTLRLAEADADLVAALEYNTDLFEAATIRRMLGHFRMLVEQAVANPQSAIDAIPMMTEPETRQLLTDWNDTGVEYRDDKCIHDLFEEQVCRTPDRVAVVFGEQRLTFAELNLKANKLGGHLRRLGAGPESRVGICIERCMGLAIALLGVLKAGAAYVPVDPSSPKERLDLILRDSGVKVLLTQERFVDTIDPGNAAVVCIDRDCEAIESGNPELLHDVRPENLAYVIYTSGSTGKPKGVSITHGSLVNSTLARLSYYREPLNAFLLLSPVAFDSSVAGIFWSLCGGGTLVIPDEESIVDPERLAELISLHSVSHLLTLPPFYSLILERAQIERFSSLRLAIVAGEACPVELVIDHESSCPSVALFNEYGPTEATVWSSVARCEADDRMRRVPIGRPISNARIYLLDSQLNPVPIGVPGELYVGGKGLARGYLGRSDLTAERFIPDPFGFQHGSRLYKTGDLGRFLPNADIEFLGRNDFQVKLRGMRIELGEIETLLRQHDHLTDAVVILRDGPLPQDKRLVAYVVQQPASPISAKELKDYLRQKLPDYMVPATYVHIDQLPLTSSGKVNRLALPPPDENDLAVEADYREPEAPVEKVIAAIWEEVLGKKRVGANDNFFEIGGHSLVATQVMSRVREALRVEVGLRKLFEEPTVSGLARAILASAETRTRVQKTAEILLALSELSEHEAEHILEQKKRGQKHREQAG